MKALLRKDLYELVTSMRSVFLILAVFCVVGMLNPGSSFLLSYPVLLTGAMATTFISLEERCGWMVQCGTIPVNRKQIVMEKYLFMFLLLAAGAAVSTICFATYLLRGVMSGGLAQIFVQYLGAGLMMPTLLVPLAYKFGTEKGRYVMMLLLVVVIVLVMSNSEKGSVNMGSFLPAAFPSILFLVFALVLYVISMFISIRIYENKEISE